MTAGAYTGPEVDRGFITSGDPTEFIAGRIAMGYRFDPATGYLSSPSAGGPGAVNDPVDFGPQPVAIKLMNGNSAVVTQSGLVDTGRGFIDSSGPGLFSTVASFAAMSAAAYGFAAGAGALVGGAGAAPGASFVDYGPAFDSTAISTVPAAAPVSASSLFKVASSASSLIGSAGKLAGLVGGGAAVGSRVASSTPAAAPASYGSPLFLSLGGGGGGAADPLALPAAGGAWYDTTAGQLLAGIAAAFGLVLAAKHLRV